ncbi:hypothetical protein J2S17_002621 [Cytobacillus purgationiresistens]|uniref:Uncharacterized protein n=1 Tax=Cytobacillus purgationiresistens TaxID=863449 RepID=A0ABU0AHK0_9BACI|nr:hypothetical protein [Cytobacillus purgationiresistens]
MPNVAISRFLSMHKRMYANDMPEYATNVDATLFVANA